MQRNSTAHLPLPAARAAIDAMRPERIDMHCHSLASTEADEAVLMAIQCPESFSQPLQVYQQAKRRGMDFFTLTDHDVISGVVPLINQHGLRDVIVGEELTCYFPEDHCKMHVLIWGFTPEDHQALQDRAEDIYRCAEYIEAHRIPHAVAHPLYRQNDKLERWHLERLMLMFKGFECLNGAHSALHREAFEPMIDSLSPAEMQRLAAKHGMAPRWPEPWFKARTAGSDDHGLFNLGRTWTEFPPETNSIEDVLECLRQGRCKPGGEAGSSLKLAHNFYSVGIQYYGQKLTGDPASPSLTGLVLQTLVGQRPRIRKRDVIRAALKSKLRSAGQGLKRVARPWRMRQPRNGTALLTDLFISSARSRLAQHPQLADALRNGFAPLGEHHEMFRLVSGLNRDIAEGIAAVFEQSLAGGDIGGLFDTLSAIAMQQFVLLPYYFALFHQNRERAIFSRITGHGSVKSRKTLKVCVFTDTFDEINGVTRFIRDMAEQAGREGLSLTVASCNTNPKGEHAYRKNFQPLLNRRMPQYPELSVTLPPIAEIMEWADRQQFDAIHVDTPGPMGLCGLVVASMLKAPIIGTYHTDFPAYVYRFTADHRLTTATAGYMRWFYSRMARVLSRSRQYHTNLKGIGLEAGKLAIAHPCFNPQSFGPQHRSASLWPAMGVKEPHRLLYVGRVSSEKNLELLAAAFQALCRTRSDVALIVVGDGPYLPEMKRKLAGLRAYFPGYQNDAQLGPIYASSDMFVFPSRTDTMGQVVIEAQASGLPVLVSDEGGPQEVMDDGVTGLVLPGTDAGAWAQAIDALLNDTPRRQRMARTAPQRMTRFSVEKTFNEFWDELLRSAQAGIAREQASVPAAPVATAATQIVYSDAPVFAVEEDLEPVG